MHLSRALTRPCLRSVKSQQRGGVQAWEAFGVSIAVHAFDLRVKPQFDRFHHLQELNLLLRTKNDKVKKEQNNYARQCRHAGYGLILRNPRQR